jgi:hypothetical protein
MHAFASVTSGQLYVFCNIFCYKSVKVLYYRKREEIFRQVDFEKKKQIKGIKLAENFNNMGKILDLKERM